ncbi:hypothetical protein [Lacticigenium naphthae]|uniref:hypothetical protein n=1 Tax=Lacticigenium naphthae TaxID=515351 RepID=UPI0004145B15|nr:hypothetical protein [Lacticigenium naphthae]
MIINELVKELEIPEIALYRDEPDGWEQFTKKDSPLAFYDLPVVKQEQLVEWCEGLDKRKTTNPLHDTYNLKHVFEHGRFYVSNGAMKGALVLSGFTPDDLTRLNWRFNISEKSLKKEYNKAGYIQ